MSAQPFVRREREELDEVVGERDALEELPRLVEAPAGERLPPIAASTLASSSDSIRRTNSGVIGVPSAVTTPLCTHCHTCDRLISAVAASSIRLKIATAPLPRSHASRYWMPTLTLLRRPASVTSPGVALASSSSAAETTTSSRCRSIWFGRSPSLASKTSRATGTRSGWATHQPSKPSSASRVLSARTAARAASFTTGSRRFGMKAAIPPIAWAPRR